MCCLYTFYFRILYTYMYICRIILLGIGVDTTTTTTTYLRLYQNFSFLRTYFIFINNLSCQNRYQKAPRLTQFKALYYQFITQTYKLWGGHARLTLYGVSNKFVVYVLCCARTIPSNVTVDAKWRLQNYDNL